jgi:micrococcal nuclease
VRPFIHSILVFILIASIARAADAAGKNDAPLPRERVLVTEVIDGDTIIVLRGARQETIRLIGVDTPETGRPDTPVQFYGPEAADFTRRSLLKQRVTLAFEPPDRPGGSTDRYHRTLAYVFTDDGRNFNLELVRLGYGRAYTRYPFRYQRDFEAAQQNARRTGTGMWNAEKREAWSDPSRRGTVIGNLRTGIYHVPGQKHYQDIREKNRLYFRTEEEARAAGYRKAKQ